jgi:hypothetical protein
VLAEVTGWCGHGDDKVQKMQEGVARIAAQGGGIID